jgi:type II secretory pathway predicted ATPase ExeA
LAELGFLEEPFLETPDERFLCLTSQHRNVLTRLQDIIEDRRGVGVVEGGTGVGKSSTAYRLRTLYRVQPQQYTVLLREQAGYASEFEGLQDLCDGFGLSRRKGLDQQWKELRSYLESEYKYDRNVVVILDNAHEIAREAVGLIHLLNGIVSSGKHLAQVILFGQPELTETFPSTSDIRKSVEAWLRLIPLSFEDTLDLIHFRSRVAGREQPLLTRNGQTEMFDRTRGIPIEIVRLCSRIVDELTPENNIADLDLIRRVADADRLLAEVES